MDQNLAQLAEIASAVSRQHQSESLPQPPHRFSNQSNFGAVATALRKRSSLSTTASLPKLPQEPEVPVAKRQKVESAAGGEHNVRFREYQAEIWSEKFEELCMFRRYFGHCHVPHTYEANAPLAQWVKRQRYQYKLRTEGKRSTLSDERVRLLNDLGFIWNSHDAVWEERLNELLLFKKIYGHCIVPSSYDPNPQLAVWVKRQRRQYKFLCEGKPTSMTPERIAKLELHGFAWDCRKSKDDDKGGSKPKSPVFPSQASKPQNDSKLNSGMASKISAKPQPPASASTATSQKAAPKAFPRCEFLSFGSRGF